MSAFHGRLVVLAHGSSLPENRQQLIEGLLIRGKNWALGAMNNRTGVKLPRSEGQVIVNGDDVPDHGARSL